MVLGPAANGQADAIVTVDNRDFGVRVERLGVQVLSPGKALHRLETAMRKSNFALRLQPSLLNEARKLAESEGVALNQLINVAVAKKLSALRTETYFAERAARADVPRRAIS